MVTLGDRTGTISAVGGEPVPSVQRFIAGYQAGAASARPEVAVLIGYTQDFRDPAKGKAVALGQIARGSRVVFQVAARVRLWGPSRRRGSRTSGRSASTSTNPASARTC